MPQKIKSMKIILIICACFLFGCDDKKTWSKTVVLDKTIIWNSFMNHHIEYFAHEVGKKERFKVFCPGYNEGETLKVWRSTGGDYWLSDSMDAQDGAIFW